MSVTRSSGSKNKTGVFNRYAAYYDLFYRRKNYKKECEFLENIFQRYAPSKPKTILDLGCGTGGHMIPLAQKGYRMTGVDRSPGMLQLAQEKFRRMGLKARFREDNLPSFQLGAKFDAVISMFSVMDYLVKDRDLQETLERVREHMKARSIFVFDFWNAAAVEQFYSPRKRQTWRLGNRILERTSCTKLLPKKQLCEVR